MRVYLATFSPALFSTQEPIRVPVHVTSWPFPKFRALRKARNYGKRRGWTLNHLKRLA